MDGVPRSPQTTVLVVDDDRKIVQLVRTYLERDGHRVVAANDGPQALDVFEAERPDLVVLDLMLPEMDGYEVCRRIRANADTPILMLTARSPSRTASTACSGRGRLPAEALQPC